MTNSTSGVLYVHSTPRALCPHIQWAVSAILGIESLELDWGEQPAHRPMVRAEFEWNGAVGTGARLASGLRGWEHLRYEVTEEPSAGVDGGRWSHTPDLGIYHAVVDAHGNVMVPEDRIRAAVDAGAMDVNLMRAEIDRALGRAWDDELEPFRQAAEGAPVRWLHRVG